MKIKQGSDTENNKGVGEKKTATEVVLEVQHKDMVKGLLKEFHEYWKQHGEPHPSSNAYMSLNRAFFYTKGLETGSGLSFDFFDDPIKQNNKGMEVIKDVCGSKNLNMLSESEYEIYAECFVCGKKVTINKAHYSKKQLRQLRGESCLA